MAKPLNRKRKTAPKRVLRLPDLDLAKRTVLNSLGSPDSARAYAHANRLSARFNRSRSNRRSGLARSWRLMRFVGRHGRNHMYGERVYLAT